MAAKLKNVRSRFSIRTPSAVCAVRGTDFFIGVSSAATEIGLFEGQLDVQNGEKNAQLSAGNEAVAAPGSDVTVNAYFSRTMKAEQRRYLRLKKYTEDLRQKLAARDGFIDEFVKGQQEKLQEFENRRRDKLNRRKE
jgi:ferric-dicitrate binding protein FerR (iron transport regulator)